MESERHEVVIDKADEAVMDEAELRRMSRDERRQLARILTELDGPLADDPGQDGPYPRGRDVGGQDPGKLANPYLRNPKLARERRVALIIAGACCVILAGWIVVLVATLPHHFDAHHWRAVWVNFDIFLLAAFAATAWAIWRERQVLILLLVATGTMLCCDAWFDVGTSLATRGLWLSLASALFAELPLALLAFAGACLLLRATVEAATRVPAQAPDMERSLAGTSAPSGTTRSLCRTPLSGHGLDEALPTRRARRRAEQAHP
jgi:hypothetical protein